MQGNWPGPCTKRWRDGPASGPEPLIPEDEARSTILEQAGFDYLYIVVSRKEIEARDLSRALHARPTHPVEANRPQRSWNGSASPSTATTTPPEELFEIPEVRDYVQALDRRFPYWLYFLDKRTSSFDAIWRCFMPPYLTPQAQAEEFPRRLDPLLRNWWTPAMDSVCEFVDMSQRQHYNLCERYALYFQGRRDF